MFCVCVCVALCVCVVLCVCVDEDKVTKASYALSDLDVLNEYDDCCL